MRRPLSLKDLITDDLTSARHPNLAEDVTGKLRDLILVEKLPPGLALNERDLSGLLGVSRTPVREAIHQLEAEGLVEYSQTRRPFVANPSLKTLSEWLLVIGALEGLAGEQACANASDRELRQIGAKFDEMVARSSEDDPLVRFTLDMDFHRMVVAAARIPALAETHNQYNARLWRARYLSTLRKIDRREQALRHKPICDALLARDGTAAARALREHLGNAIGNIETAIAERKSAQS